MIELRSLAPSDREQFIKDNNGYATEALSGVIEYLTKHEDFNVITAWCASDNIGSMKTMGKAGMRQASIKKNALEVDGIIHDKLIFEYVSH